MKTALVLLQQGFGNVIMGTPVISALRTLGYWVEAFVRGTWSDTASVLAGCPQIARLHDRQLDSGLRTYDAVIRTVWANMPSLDVGPEYGVTDDISDEAIHEVDLNLSALKPLGWSAARGSARRFCNRGTPPLPGLRNRVVATIDMGIAQMWEKRAWRPATRWLELADRVRDEFGEEILFTGNAHDAALFKRALKDAGAVDTVDLLTTSLDQFLGVLAAARCVVGTNGGPTHLSSALGVPTVCLFGPTNERRTAPYGEKTVILKRDLDCRPCQRSDQWHHCRNYRCMDIGADRVIEAMELVGMNR